MVEYSDLVNTTQRSVDVYRARALLEVRASPFCLEMWFQHPGFIIVAMFVMI